MTRPTKEQVDNWLNTYRPGDSDEVECDDCSCQATYGLAREVVALREELLEADQRGYERRYAEEQQRKREIAIFRPVLATQSERDAYSIGHADGVAATKANHALADEIAGLVVQSIKSDNSELRATIARVEALPAKWRAKAGWFRPPLFTNAEHTLITNTYEGCADDLEAALKR